MKNLATKRWSTFTAIGFSSHNCSSTNLFLLPGTSMAIICVDYYEYLISPNFDHLLNFPSVSQKIMLSSYTLFLFSKGGRMCLITNNIIKNCDILLEQLITVHIQKTSVFEVRQHVRTSTTTFIFHKQQKQCETNNSSTKQTQHLKISGSKFF